MAILHANQQIIEKETKQVKNELNKFYKEIDNWTSLYNEFNEKLMVYVFYFIKICLGIRGCSKLGYDNRTKLKRNRKRINNLACLKIFFQ